MTAPEDLWDFALCPGTCVNWRGCFMSGRCWLIDDGGWLRFNYDTLSPAIRRPVRVTPEDAARIING